MWSPSKSNPFCETTVSAFPRVHGAVSVSQQIEKIIIISISVKHNSLTQPAGKTARESVRMRNKHIKMRLLTDCRFVRWKGKSTEHCRGRYCFLGTGVDSTTTKIESTKAQQQFTLVKVWKLQKHSNTTRELLLR